MDLARAIRHLVSKPDADLSCYVLARAGQRLEYEADGYTFVGSIDEAKGVTGRTPMIVMERPALPVSAPVAKPDPSAVSRRTGWLSRRLGKK